MKKIVLLLMVVSVTVFQFCSSSRKAAEASKITYIKNVKPVIQANCTPCHIPPQGRAEAFHTYEAAKAHIDDMITRIQKDPAEKGFMPLRHPKLPDSTIAVFVRWKEAGLAEK